MTNESRAFFSPSPICTIADEGNKFFDRISLVDKSWIHFFEPQQKQENAEWHTPSLKKKLAWCIQGALKVMHVMFYSQNTFA
jgi:hypothetical protein